MPTSARVLVQPPARIGAEAEKMFIEITTDVMFQILELVRVDVDQLPIDLPSQLRGALNHLDIRSFRARGSVASVHLRRRA